MRAIESFSDNIDALVDRPPQRRAILTGVLFAGTLAALIVLGSRGFMT